MRGSGLWDAIGAAATMFKAGDRVLISCITACAKINFYCRKLMYSHLHDPRRFGFIGNKIGREPNGRVRPHSPRRYQSSIPLWKGRTGARKPLPC